MGDVEQSKQRRQYKPGLLLYTLTNKPKKAANIQIKTGLLQTLLSQSARGTEAVYKVKRGCLCAHCARFLAPVPGTLSLALATQTTPIFVRWAKTLTSAWPSWVPRHSIPRVSPTTALGAFSGDGETGHRRISDELGILAVPISQTNCFLGWGWYSHVCSFS